LLGEFLFGGWAHKKIERVAEKSGYSGIQGLRPYRSVLPGKPTGDFEKHRFCLKKIQEKSRTHGSVPYVPVDIRTYQDTSGPLRETFQRQKRLASST